MRGGARPGAGRPKAETKRKQRKIYFFDGEWAAIQKKAEARNMPVREYLYRLAENDSGAWALPPPTTKARCSAV
ncbi:MAG: hypothetical protein FWH41_08360 [Treponema sp.]|nr:hypothetical protein [Treponema sp.]